MVTDFPQALGLQSPEDSKYFWQLFNYRPLSGKPLLTLVESLVKNPESSLKMVHDLGGCILFGQKQTSFGLSLSFLNKSQAYRLTPVKSSWSSSTVVLKHVAEPL